MHPQKLLLLPLTALCLYLAPAAAQNCEPGTTSNDSLKNNHLEITVGQAGELFPTGENGGFIVNPTAENTVPYNVMSRAGLWIGARDAAGALQVSSVTYGPFNDNRNFQPGPVYDDPTQTAANCGFWNRHFKVSQDEITAVRRSFLAGTLRREDVPTNILGWPATENPYFEETWGASLPDATTGMAPFYDEDLDGIYDPLAGDYPDFCGGQALYSVFNDMTLRTGNDTPPLGIEVHQLVRITEGRDDIFAQTVLVDYLIVNKSLETKLDLHAGLWIDPDLGCFNNDLASTLPAENLLYVYNDSPDEGTSCPSGLTPTGVDAPALVVKMLSGFITPVFDDDGFLIGEEDLQLTSLAGYISAAFGSPPPGMLLLNTPERQYNVLRGSWPDGSSIGRSGNGFDNQGAPTSYLYDGGDTPAGTPWKGCAPNDFFLDHRYLAASGPTFVEPGGVKTLSFALAVTKGVEYANDCPVEDQILEVSSALEGIGEAFRTCELPVSTNTDVVLANTKLRVFPNPTRNRLNFELPQDEKIKRLTLYTATGQRLVTNAPSENFLSIDLSTHQLPAGLLIYHLQTEGGEVKTGKVVLL
ncbi:T9SS type A sorting domain-containing protein [Lewinella sp. 4G2]|uniref:T9SS type A sorting domain-containing protein n=1 Tax=Lewinella sp. 4G2 TaxID=1803372 RepID=UPI0007B4D3B8|nr:T9SS type A sorting domain-containing protein [Lewinella sp. 4G2]OAV44795.1 hypothetical protein A3850_009970 [Lewinella sp. 4G2]